MNVLLVDNKDSFTWNLAAALRTSETEIRVVRSDDLGERNAAFGWARKIVISPGPGRPERARGSWAAVDHALKYRKPLLGVCLGHQVVGAFFGASVAPCSDPVHGRTSVVEHDGASIYEGLPSTIEVMRYHSLSIEDGSLPECLRVDCRLADEKRTIMGFRHRAYPIIGIQYHPESFLTPCGQAMLDAFLWRIE